MAEGTVAPAIGIDLGTTYSCVGYWRNDRVEIISNDQGNRVTPSYVAFTQEEVLVGDEALNQVSLNPVNTVFDAKRLIGRRFSDESVLSDMKLWPFKVVLGPNDRPMISFSYKGKKMNLAPEQISMVLRKLKEISEAYIGSEVKDAVVTVPAYFNQSQRQATMDAAEIAGINVLRIINEPTGAAIAYGFENSLSFAEKKNVLVFNLGGGTFDVSILAIENGNFEAKATAGDGHLGGEDFDNRTVNYYIKELNRMHSKKLKKKRNKDISKNPKAMGRLRSACERAKRTLSSTSNATIVIDTLFEGIDFSATLYRSKFEELNLDLFNKCIETIKGCLSDAKMKKDAIDHVVLVGGSSRIPRVQQLLVDFFDGKDLSRSIHQDEAVAFGAAIQAAFLCGHGNGKVQNLVLTDVTTLYLGINTRGEVMHVLIPRNTTIPTRKVERFVTSVNNQAVLAFRVFKGERERSTENYLLGELQMTGLRLAPKGEVKVDVCFDLQPGGILTLSAKDITTGQEASLTVTTGQLPREEVKTMIEEAKKLREEDQNYLDRNLAKLVFRDHVFQLRDDTTQKKQKIDEAIQWLQARDGLAEVNEYEEMKELMNL